MIVTHINKTPDVPYGGTFFNEEKWYLFTTDPKA